MATDYPSGQPVTGLPADPTAPPPQVLGERQVRMVNNDTLEAEQVRQAAAIQNSPVILELAGYVQNAWQEAQTERSAFEERMMQSLRQRRGEYDANKLQEIRQQGGSEIYMMLTSVKCRAAASWLRDSLLGHGEDKPWTINPTPVPELTQEMEQFIQQRIQMEVQKFLNAGGLPPTEEMVQTAVEIARDRVRAEQVKASKKAAKYCEDRMEDQLLQGKFERSFHQFIDDLVTFPAAFMKGPVIRKKPEMTWGPNGEPVVEDKIRMEWERVSPLYIYPSPQAEGVHDGYLIERHILSRKDLTEMIGVEGYHEASIREVLREYGRGGLNEWLNIDTGSDSREETHHRGNEIPSATIDALQFWGSVPGDLLREWGIQNIEDPVKEYECEVWLVGRWVIKATLNPDPLKRRPYFKACYEDIPGQFWGHGVPDLIRDTQNVCNAACRALCNNMGFASGPQVWINVERLPDGEEVTQLHPWKIFQGTSDPTGASGPPVGFFQPKSLAAELMGIYEKFSDLADEYSGVPKYMTGTEAAGGAGRTASGLSMMMSNAGKAIKQVIGQIDKDVVTPLLEYLHYYNMRYAKDPNLKNGDIKIVARGASGLMGKEAQQVRINEFLGLTIGNQTVAQIIGPAGIAALLRQSAQRLDLDTDKIVPSEEMIRADQMAQEQEQKALMMQQQALMEQMRQQPIETLEIERDPQTGEQKRIKVMPGIGPGQNLMDGTPQTDNFQPQRRAS